MEIIFSLKENPLYPPKKESSAIGVLAAIAIVIIVLDILLMDGLNSVMYGAYKL